VRALGLKHALSAKAKSEQADRHRRAATEGPKTKALVKKFAALGLTNALIIGGAELDENFARRAQHSEHRRAAGQGINVYDILRRGTLVLTQGRGRGSRGALQMTDLRHYDVIVSPVITEKSTMASEHNQVVFNVPRRRPSRRSRPRSRRCSASR
jgi:hypothetical protein